MAIGTIMAGGFDGLIILFVVGSIIFRIFKAMKQGKPSQQDNAFPPSDAQGAPRPGPAPRQTPVAPQDELTQFLKALTEQPPVPVPAPTPRPVAKPVPQPVARAVAQPAVRPVAQPVARRAAKPVAKPAPPPIKTPPTIVGEIKDAEKYDVAERHTDCTVADLRLAVGNDLVKTASLRKGILLHAILGEPLGLG